MKAYRWQWLVGLVGLISVIIVTLVFWLSMMSSTRVPITEPFQVDWSTHDMRDFSAQDPSNQFSSYYETLSTRDFRYAIGASVVNQNDLPLVRQYDHQGNTIQHTYFGLETIDIDEQTFYGEVAKIVYWESQQALLVTLEIPSTMVVNGTSLFLGGEIGALLETTKTYQDYITVLLKMDLNLEHVELLYVIGDQAEASTLYSLYQVIPNQDDVLMLFQYQPDDELPFAFENPHPQANDANMLFQRFTYDENLSSLNPVLGDTLVFSSPLYENVYCYPGTVDYLPMYVVDGLLNISIRMITETEVERPNLQTWLDDFVFTGLKDEIVEALKATILERFNEFPEEENLLFTYVDLSLLIHVEDFTIVEWVIHDKVGNLGVMMQSQLITNIDKTFWLLSLRYYGFDEELNRSIQIMTTWIYRIEDNGSSTLLTVIDEEESFYAFGFFRTENSLVVYGNQYIEIAGNPFNTDAMIITIDLSTQVIAERLIFGGSGYDSFLNSWFDFELNQVLLSVYVETPDGDFDPFAETEVDQQLIVLIIHNISQTASS